MSDGSAVSLLRKRLKPVLAVSADKVKPMLADLDNESFQKRQEAVKQLKLLGLAAAPALRRALEADPSLEMKRRVQEVLTALESPEPLTAEAVRELRAVVALERVGNREARETLAALTKGVPDARLTREAKAALERLARLPAQR